MRHLLIALYSCCYAFVPPLAPRQRRHHHAILPRPPSSSSSSHGHPSALRATREQAENDGDADNERTPEMELASNWQYQRVRLEEQFARERRRRGPRHLPYEAARSWAAHQGCTSEREWKEWVDLGEGWSSVRTHTQAHMPCLLHPPRSFPSSSLLIRLFCALAFLAQYIPTRPDEYYAACGDWISWEHFLGVQSAPVGAEADDLESPTPKARTDLETRAERMTARWEERRKCDDADES